MAVYQAQRQTRTWPFNGSQQAAKTMGALAHSWILAHLNMVQSAAPARSVATGCQDTVWRDECPKAYQNINRTTKHAIHVRRQGFRLHCAAGDDIRLKCLRKVFYNGINTIVIIDLNEPEHSPRSCFQTPALKQEHSVATDPDRAAAISRCSPAWTADPGRAQLLCMVRRCDHRNGSGRPAVACAGGHGRRHRPLQAGLASRSRSQRKFLS